jgi:thiamine-monophosphate kinase
MSVAGEFEIIARYFAPLAAGYAGAFGLTDDAAVIAPRPGFAHVVTNDALVEGVHYRADDPPGDVARKALRVNLSDLAAMGAMPRYYNLALALSPRVDEAWLSACADALGEDQARFGVVLIGGDTVSTPGPVTIAVTAMGEVAEGQALTRGGARPGDRIFVSGSIGDAGAGLALLTGDPRAEPADREALIRRYRVPEPRTDLGPALVGLATAAIDVSDGLLADLGHVCDVSGCGATVALDAVPVSAAAGRCTGYGRLDAVAAGDDYELLFTAPETAAAHVAAAAEECGVAVTAIGSIEAGQGVRLVDSAGDPVAVTRTGYQHF